MDVWFLVKNFRIKSKTAPELPHNIRSTSLFISSISASSSTAENKRVTEQSQQMGVKMKSLSKPISYFAMERQWSKIPDSIWGSGREFALSLNFILSYFKYLQLTFVSWNFGSRSFSFPFLILHFTHPRHISSVWGRVLWHALKANPVALPLAICSHSHTTVHHSALKSLSFIFAHWMISKAMLWSVALK